MFNYEYQMHKKLSEREIYSVTRLNTETRLLLESHYDHIWVTGEISNLSKPQSGHWYFTLKDERSAVRCAMFRMRNLVVNFPIVDGSHVVVQAKVSLYPERGDYQLIVERMEEDGTGLLQRAFEQLKEKLSAEGLFALDRKRPLPRYPRCVGVITSPTGAAVHDILTTLKRRFPSLPVIIYPTEVQGKAAAPGIIRALQLAEQRQECDVIVLARGGGSLEDLWAFNEESVARAIIACPIPIITGIGHEVDVTIADFVADFRAATPSAAAESISPDTDMLQHQMARLLKQLITIIQRIVQNAERTVTHLQKRLRHPSQQLQHHAQHLDFQYLRLCQLMQAKLSTLHHRYSETSQRFVQRPPQHLIALAQHRVEIAKTLLENRMQTLIASQQQRFALVAQTLHTVSPLATLHRGYAIASTHDHSILRSVRQVHMGDCISVRLAEGELNCEVMRVTINEKA